MVEIIPAVIPKSYSNLVNTLGRIGHFVSVIQIDVTDGLFVSDKSWPYIEENDSMFLALVRKESELPFFGTMSYEVDLMVEEPEHEIGAWVSMGISRIIVHIESTKNVSSIIRYLAESDVEHVSLGLAVNTSTNVAELEPFIDAIDFVQCMGIDRIGKQGEQADPRVLEQLKKLRALHPSLILSVDGGVRFENARALVDAGANRLVSGSLILESEKPEETIKTLYAMVNTV
ncbi:MAG TPA: hypothetical protein VJH21_02400 [Candidatus Paceibacterota bacterium]